MKTINQKTSGSEYQARAIARLKDEAALCHFRYLSKLQWPNCQYFWEWLATSPTGEIILNSEDLTMSSFKRTAVHEAGHAVVDYLTGMVIQSVTVAPNFKKNCTGRTYVTPEAVHPKLSLSYRGWRFLLSALVGPMAEEKLCRKVSGHSMGDIATAIDLLYSIFPNQEWPDWKSRTIIFADWLVNSSLFAHSVQLLSNRLLEQGTVGGPEVKEIIEQQIKRAGKSPDVIKHLERWNSLFLATPLHGQFSADMDCRKWANDLFAQEIHDLCLHRSVGNTMVMDYLLGM